MKFRIAYFTPDPFRADRFAVGVLFGDETSARFERAKIVPGPECLGGRNSWATMELALDTLSMLNRMDVERGVGTQLISFGAVVEMPTVENPEEWLHATMLNRTRLAVERQPSPRREKRETYGNRFFKTWHVSDYVKPHFQISEFVHSKDALPIVQHRPAHWVSGQGEILLMEAIIGTRASLEQDLKIVSESFLAHTQIFEMTKGAFKPEMVAYVFSNGYRGAVDDTKRAIQRVARVVNVEDDGERSSFLDRIREVGKKDSNLFD